mgnify:CR=1 FL=1
MSKYFKEIEENMSVYFLDKLDDARELAGIPFYINSAYRTEEENKRVGGKPNSSHLKGLAVDIKAKDSRTRFAVLNALIQTGFTRIGIADTFIHVDLDKNKSQQVIWTYK